MNYKLFREYLFEKEAAKNLPPFLSQNRPEKVKKVYRALKRDHPGYSAKKKARIASSMAKSAAIPATQHPSGVGMGVSLHDDARAYGIRAGKGGPQDSGLAYSHGVLEAGGAGVLGGAGAAAVTGSPFLTSTLLSEKKRNAAIQQGLKDAVTVKSEAMRLGGAQIADAARKGLEGVAAADPATTGLGTAGQRVATSALNAMNSSLSSAPAPATALASTELSPEFLDIIKRRGRAAIGGGLVGLGVGALGKGLYNATQYHMAKNLANKENVEAGAVKNASLLVKIAEVEYRGRTFPGYNRPIDSDRPEKKKMVLAKKGDQIKLIHFGQKGYKHNYSDAAKKNYLTRSAGIRGKDGSLTANDKLSANYWARRELWPKNEPADGSAKNREKRASDDDFGHKTELAGLGILAAPAAAHLAAKVPGLRRAAKPLSDFLHKNDAIEHAVEVGGLGVLAVPAIKHFKDKRKKSTAG
jgi:hypothetical protein